MMTIAAGKSRGNPESSVASAAGPPAEAPIATSGTGPLDGAAAELRAVVQSPISRESTLIFASIGRAVAVGSASNSGRSTASSAPLPIAANASRALSSTLAVTIRIAHGVCAMIRRVASTPSIRGMIRSIKIRSGRSAPHMRTASSPSRAIHAT